MTIRQRLCGLGATIVVVCGCSGDEPGPGSKVGGGGSSGSPAAGNAGSLNLGVGTGGGGAGGAASGGHAGAAQAGSSAAGTAGQAASAGNGNAGSGSCARASAADADCLDFYEDKPQAYACTDRKAYSALNNLHEGACASVNFVPGGDAGACCPP